MKFPFPLASPALQAALLSALVGLPLVVLAALVVSPSWPDTLACGDDGNIELFTWHAVHDAQLAGMSVHGNVAEHPGPAAFYLLAPGYWLLGCKYAGLRLGVIAVNLCALAGTICLCRRHGSLAAALWLALLLTGYIHFAGLFRLADVWLPWLVMLPFLAAMFLLAAVAAGRPWCLPAAAFLASFIGQSQLGYAPVLAATTAAALLLLAWPALRRAPGWLGHSAAVPQFLRSEAAPRLLGHRCALPQPPTAAPDPAGLRGALVASLAVLAVLWVLPAIQQFTGRPGRISATAGFFARQAAGHDWAQTGRVMELVAGAFPAALVGGDAKPALAALAAPPDGRLLPVRLLGLGLALVLPLAYWAARRGGRPRDAALCLLWFVFAAAGTMSVWRLPGGIVFHHVFWLTMLGLLGLYLIGSAALGQLGRWLGSAARPRLRAAGVALAVIALGAGAAWNTAAAISYLPILRGQRADPLLYDPRDEAIQGGAQADARRFLAAAEKLLAEKDVRQYRLRVAGLHHCGVMTGLVVGLTKAGRPPLLDPWYARALAPRQADVGAASEGQFVLCARTLSDRWRGRPGWRLVAESRPALLYWSPQDRPADAATLPANLAEPLRNSDNGSVP